jgi:hypothetical protein
MERPLQVGDDVIVIKGEPCCGDITHLGLIFTISDISPGDGGGNICNFCMTVSRDVVVWKGKGHERLGFYPHTVKRLRPPKEVQEDKIYEINSYLAKVKKTIEA